jgi:hypothetical protein
MSAKIRSVSTVVLRDRDVVDPDSGVVIDGAEMQQQPPSVLE